MFDAIVLAGGSGSRLGGRDKAAIELQGESLLTRSLDAVCGARHRVVVGPQREGYPGVVWAREEPSGTGPVAAIEAGVAETRADVVVVVAVDHPLVTPLVIAELVAEAGGGISSMAEDVEGRPQPLVAAYDAVTLRTRLRALPSTAGARVSDLVAGIEIRTVQAHTAALDVDTADDLNEIETRMEVLE